MIDETNEEMRCPWWAPLMANVHERVVSLSDVPRILMIPDYPELPAILFGLLSCYQKARGEAERLFRKWCLDNPEAAKKLLG